ncbi:WhiB family transcriptional regulator [Streptomyces canus]|uniref:WhiB family transcriptional regulator n=1 Tax=Streptomyces canus TaxID=58343 RepID=UPI0032461F7F
MSADRYAWMDRAVCAEIDADLFTETAPGNGSRALKRICDGCPVRVECAAHELALRDSDWGPLAGIWGGLSQRQRIAGHQQAA